MATATTSQANPAIRPELMTEGMKARRREIETLGGRQSTGTTSAKAGVVSTATEGDDVERRLARVIAPEGISAFVFNFVDLLTHGRSESAILYEVARDEIALRQHRLRVQESHYAGDDARPRQLFHIG